jgi:hypothetical protein
MRISMGIIKNQHGVYHLRKKVPKRLEAAVALVTGAAKERVSWLKKTLDTKDHKSAKVRAVPLLMEFDRILAQAEALTADRPLRTSLSDKEIERLAQYYFAAALAEEEEMRRDGPKSEKLFQGIAKQLTDAGVEFTTPFHIGPVPEYGLSDRQMQKRAADLEADIALAEDALARGNISAITKPEIKTRLQGFKRSFYDRSIHNAWTVANQSTFWPRRRSLLRAEIQRGRLGDAWAKAAAWDYRRDPL